VTYLIDLKTQIEALEQELKEKNKIRFEKENKQVDVLKKLNELEQEQKKLKRVRSLNIYTLNSQSKRIHFMKHNSFFCLFVCLLYKELIIEEEMHSFDETQQKKREEQTTHFQQQTKLVTELAIELQRLQQKKERETKQLEDLVIHLEENKLLLAILHSGDSPRKIISFKCYQHNHILFYYFFLV
jgi:hypothetical protein